MANATPYRLLLIRVFVTDWQRALHFYADTLGMPIATRSDAYHWAELDTGAAHLAIEPIAPDDPEHGALVGRFLGVSLGVADVHATHARLVERGVEFLEPPSQMPWGGVLAHFRDPEGNVLTLIGPPRSE
jgi:predicted enzyme related to lactoylglutathione lyase